jgi:two-component system response regulator FixJ
LTNRIEISVIDDDQGARESMCSLVESAGYAPRGYASAKLFLEDFSLAACAIVDVHMPEMGGLELQEAVIRCGAVLPIIFVTGRGDVALAVQALQEGAVDFIEKPFTVQIMLNSIVRAMKIGQQSSGDSVKVKGAEAILALLTPREQSVMNLLVNGCSTKGAAYELGISPRTAELYRARIMDKTSARNIADVVRLVMTARGYPSHTAPGSGPMRAGRAEDHTLYSSVRRERTEMTRRTDPKRSRPGNGIRTLLPREGGP